MVEIMCRNHYHPCRLCALPTGQLWLQNHSRVHGQQQSNKGRVDEQRPCPCLLCAGGLAAGEAGAAGAGGSL